MRTKTLMGQNFSSLQYNCRDLIHAPMSVQCFVYVKVNFEKKNTVLHIEKFPFPVLARNTIMLQHIVIQFLLYYLSSGLLSPGQTDR